jgi:hypothetical protein
MIDGTYKKVIYYDLAALWNAGGGVSLTVNTSGYRWPKAFAVRIGTDTDIGPACPTISATYYTSAGSELTLTQQISTTSATIPNSAKSICGNATTSGFSTLAIPNNSTWGHTLCKASSGPLSWLWYPYRLIKLTYHAPTNGVPADSGLLLLF